MVTLQRSDWKVRLFRWSVGIWDEFRGGNTFIEDGTNLCFFVRVICVYMPCVLALHVAVALAAVGLFTALPIYLFGWGYAQLLVPPGVFAVLFFIGCRIEEWVKARRPNRSKVAKRIKTQPSAASLALLWVKSQKRKVCPTIEFEETAQ